MKKQTRSHRDKETTSKIMSAVKGKGSKAEKALADHMWKMGLRYRKHVKTIFGKPDFAFIGLKVAIFCDGDFWHGRGWEKRGFHSWEEQFNGLNNSDYWRDKIARNMQRDKTVTEQLKNDGWIVLRILESDILDDPARETKKIVETIHRIRSISN